MYILDSNLWPSRALKLTIWTFLEPETTPYRIGPYLFISAWFRWYWKNWRVPFFLTPNSWMLLINIFHTYVRLPEDNHGKPMKIGTDQHGPPAALREGSAQREGASQVQERPGGLRGVYHITLSHSMPCSPKTMYCMIILIYMRNMRYLKTRIQEYIHTYIHTSMHT